MMTVYNNIKRDGIYGGQSSKIEINDFLPHDARTSVFSRIKVVFTYKKSLKLKRTETLKF